MYLLTFKNGEENYHGPFSKITLDYVYDDGFTFLCLDSDSTVSRIRVSGSFEVVTEKYLEV